MTDFDVKAKRWDEVPGRKERALAVAQAIHEEVAFTAGMTAMEYGCGTGLLSFALQPFPGQILLADSSTGMLEVVREKIAASGFKNMAPMQLDLSVDPLPSRRFDLILTLMVLHHIPDTLDILQKFHSMLNLSGFLCIADLNKEDGTFHQEEFHGHHGFDRMELTGWMTGVGFSKIHFSTPYSVEKDSRSYPLFLAVGVKK